MGCKNREKNKRNGKKEMQKKRNDKEDGID